MGLWQTESAKCCGLILNDAYPSAAETCRINKLRLSVHISV